MRRQLKIFVDTHFDLTMVKNHGTVYYQNRNGQVLLAIGEVSSVAQSGSEPVLINLHSYLERIKDHVFGHFAYELKNEIEDLDSNGIDRVNAGALFFFQPRYLIKYQNGIVEVSYLPDLDNERSVKEMIEDLFNTAKEKNKEEHQKVELEQRTSRSKYIDNVKSLKGHIAKGDIYEVNYCVEFYAENVQMDPIEKFKELENLTGAPHSCYYHFGDIHVLCASPELFLNLDNGSVRSEPMKGTIKRGRTTTEDLDLKEQLKNDAKERSENVMIVDLVRNDLSKHAIKGTVRVDSLFEIKTFKTVHQMVSTICAEVQEGTSVVDLIRDTFPMGSMTGAPKIRAMQLIEEHEAMQRGIYSGSIGHIDHKGNMEMNVVIRSIIFNSKTGYLSLMVGGAITSASDPEKEYQECSLKAEALIKALL